MKEAIGETVCYTEVNCPYCNKTIEIEPDQYGLEGKDVFYSTGLNMRVTCNNEYCEKEFIVTGFES